jgi:hydroxypyruvate isomerase
MTHGLPYAANCSLLFTEVPLLERPAAARAAGFDAIEFWWPWPDQPVPTDAAVEAFIAAVRDAGVQLIGLNFFAGDLAGPDCGVLSIPARSAEFRDNIDVADRARPDRRLAGAGRARVRHSGLRPLPRCDKGSRLCRPCRP